MARSILLILYLLIAISALWIFGSQSPMQSQGLPEDEIPALRKEVREIIRPTCGSCHTSTIPTAKPKALAVFDLKNDDWSGRMTVSQLKGFDKRLDKFNPSEKSKINKLLDAERAKR